MRRIGSIHFVGIGGSGMGGIAEVLLNLGYRVTGSDLKANAVTARLEQLGARVAIGHRAENADGADVVVTSTAVQPGNPEVAAALARRVPVVPRAEMLGELMRFRQSIAVAGTHGKTTTTSLLAHLLESAGLAPGFLIGGVPGNFGVSARLGAGKPFVIEADEYDTAFFDKRSKFVHYRPRIAILNNLEYDHADIFPDVAAIQRQFHHLVRTVPRNGRLIVNAHDERLAEVLAMGCWTPVESFGIGCGDWQAELVVADGSAFRVLRGGELLGEVRWSLLGNHSVMNALAALAAASAAGADPRTLLPAFASFESVKRRMELVGDVGGVRVYDDFAHHPTAIATTLAGLRAKVGEARIVVALEPRSNSMRLGAHAEALAPSLADADAVLFLHRPGLPWDAQRVIDALHGRGSTAASVDGLLAALRVEVRPGDHVVFMSNGGFEGAPRRFAASLAR
ncbi:MAG: UDP-N-acetylmuramate:L-alanyl-gamma-D-glutamyl-meso-diaminopimelate ligase [Gammaproteobacteria bacterium]|nr:UDP-N-acetylmuramate:L-alanyl-gamma-D-glutamyl-meso-diaminopimelate ligase [Gammaproteobacteria bacterium]